MYLDEIIYKSADFMVKNPRLVVFYFFGLMRFFGV